MNPSQPASRRTADDIFRTLGLPQGADADWSAYDIADDSNTAKHERAAANRQRAREYFHAHTPPRFRHARATHPAITDWVTRYLLDPAVAGSLVLLGSTGVGKTHQAYGALANIGDSGHVAPAWVAESAPDLYARLRPSSGLNLEAEFSRVADAPLLLIDDLGAAKASEWTEETTFRIIDRRYNRCLPTIFTTNLDLDTLKKFLGDRVNSRLYQTATNIILGGADRRRAV